MKVYKLYIAKPLLVFYLFMFGAMALGGIVGIVVTALGKLGPDGPPIWIFIPWLAKLYALGFVDVVHQGGTVHLLSQMDDFHDFIATIKSTNPTAEIKGC